MHPNICKTLITLKNEFKDIATKYRTLLVLRLDFESNVKNKKIRLKKQNMYLYAFISLKK